jgi:hypothetical protein
MLALGHSYDYFAAFSGLRQFRVGIEKCMDDRKDLHASTFDQVLTRWDWLIQDLFLEARRARVSLQGSRFGARLVWKRATAFWWSNH